MPEDPQTLIQVPKHRPLVAKTNRQVKTMRLRNLKDSCSLVTTYANDFLSEAQLLGRTQDPGNVYTLEQRQWARIWYIALYSPNEAKALKASELILNRLHGKVELIVGNKKTVKSPEPLPEDIETLEAMIRDAESFGSEKEAPALEDGK